ncbi:MAG: glycosyltransferase [Bacteroidota bacterium]|nr:glycosyltransferase [Bacteroidota bacterium]
MSKVLYISYDGMTDQLGQSQVIPYLAGLSAKGHQICILSAEKKKRFENNKDNIHKLLKDNNILWYPISYTSRPPVLSTILDIIKLNIHAFKLHRKYKFDIIHCRSYISAFVGLKMKKKFNLKFIFDMRGFWADERIDGYIWNINNPFYKLIYNYFKSKEKQYLIAADHVVSLTEKAAVIILGWNLKVDLKISVIPCCTDLDHFSADNINEKKVYEFISKLNIRPEDFILTYLGSIGTWYLIDEMLAFFKRLLPVKKNARFLFITKDQPEHIISKAKQLDIPKDKIIVIPSSREDLPSLLSLSNLGIFFIRKSFSKQASSPTKHGELLGMSIPIVANSGVGDLDTIISQTGSGLIVNELNDNGYDEAISRIDNLLKVDKNIFRNTAIKYYSLENGVNLYNKIYSA